MLRKNLNGLSWLEFKLLQNHPVKHAVFTRNGGVSKPPYNSLNVGDNVGDQKDAVRENKRRIQETMGAEKLVFLSQVHHDDVEEIKTGDEEHTADGMMTSEKNLGLAIRHADCQAAIFYDTKNHIVSVVHAGWRGMVKNMYAATALKMKKTNPKDLIVCISPSLGPKAAEFVHYKKELPQSFWKYKDENNRFDFWEIAKQQLLDLDIPESQIEIASICTHANKGDWFSYRRNNATGRNTTVCSLV